MENKNLFVFYANFLPEIMENSSYVEEFWVIDSLWFCLKYFKNWSKTFFQIFVSHSTFLEVFQPEIFWY